MGKFVITTRKNGEYQFNLKANNGQIIGSSEMYESESGRENSTKSVKENAPDAATDNQT